MKTTKLRAYEIATVLFDDYVMKRLLKSYYVIDEDNGFNERELGALAAQLCVSPEKLHHAITISLGRISKEAVPIALNQDEELAVIKPTIKMRLKQSSLSLESYKRELPRLVKELNHTHFSLNLNLNELKIFLKPFFIEVINEVLEVK